ncbi:MAG: hypothetical protein WCX88_02435 [Patescibacteria group bacterium]
MEIEGENIKQKEKAIMESKFASAGLTAGQLDAIVEKLGGYEGALSFLRDETFVVEPERKWREKDGIIYLSVTSDGVTGIEWIRRLKKKGFNVCIPTEEVLSSSGFKPTSGVTTEVAILNSELFKDSNDRIVKDVRAFAAERKLEAPNAEVACLIREAFSDREIMAMGLWWVLVMHKPIEVSGEYGPSFMLFNVSREGVGSWLNVNYDKPSDWKTTEHVGGFAFVSSSS